MKTANVVVWLHGVQAEKFDPAPIQNCLDNVSGLVKSDEVWDHSLFNWDKEVSARERIIFDQVKKRGNWLTVKIRQAICFIGCDMWWTLSTVKDGRPGWVSYDILSKLDDIVKSKTEFFKTNGFDVKFHLVCHSWGTWVGMKYIIDHSDKNFNFITFGCPLFYGSGAYDDWGDPDKLPNLKQWVNIGISNDPISTFACDNPNPKWQTFVRDNIVNVWDWRQHLAEWNPLFFFPIKSHTAYWTNEKVQRIIADSLVGYSG